MRLLLDMYGYSPYTAIGDTTMRQELKTPRRSLKHGRLEARVTREQKDLIARAAALRGSSVTEFIIASAQQAAADTIKDFELLRLAGEAREAFVNAIVRPPAPNLAARKAARRYKEQVGR